MSTKFGVKTCQIMQNQVFKLLIYLNFVESSWHILFNYIQIHLFANLKQQIQLSLNQQQINSLKKKIIRNLVNTLIFYSPNKQININILQLLRKYSNHKIKIINLLTFHDQYQIYTHLHYIETWISMTEIKQNKQNQKFIFTYKGIDYDASEFVKKHPGGAQFIQNMKNQRKDITQYFKSLHSEDAQKILLSFKQVGKSEISKDTKSYMRLYQKVKHLYQPNWIKQGCFIAFVTISFLTACFTKSALLSIFCFGLSQVVTGWLAHSMNHSRNKKLYQLGNTIGPLLGGLSAPWWGYKHNMHHMFTNSTLYDEDIKHEYFTPLYPFLYLKWRFDAFISSLKTFNVRDLVCMSINYYLISRQKLIYFVVGLLIGGFYSANLLLGNHERQRRYKGQVQEDFITHQLVTCRNYPYEGLFWLTLMGGMQYQSEHHLFPQIPFYNLPKAKEIIGNQLAIMGKQVTYGSVL